MTFVYALSSVRASSAATIHDITLYNLHNLCIHETRFVLVKISVTRSSNWARQASTPNKKKTAERGQRAAKMPHTGEPQRPTKTHSYLHIEKDTFCYLLPETRMRIHRANASILCIRLCHLFGTLIMVVVSERMLCLSK